MIQTSTLSFLKELTNNNNREWFADNKARHDQARENVLDFAAEVIKGLAEIDSQIPATLEAKNCVMRIYRDIRFSTDKTPYKTNFGAGISPNGKSFNGAGYYLHISPDECFVAGGAWMPERDQLKAIRQEIDYNAAGLKESLKEFNLQNGNAGLDKEHQLKTTPKGYAADHPEIELLRLKSFTLSKQITPAELTKSTGLVTVLDGFSTIYPFMLFLRNALS